MTGDQINLACAKICEWEPIPEGYFHPDNPFGQTMPNYAGDLNATFKLLKKVNGHDWRIGSFGGGFECIFGEGGNRYISRRIDSLAMTICETVLRSKNLWKN